MIAIAVFLYLPIVIMIVFSFNSSKSRTVWTGFTLEWYSALFRNELIMSSLYTTILVSLLAAAIATVLGTAAAIGFSRMRRGTRQFFLTVNNIPAVNPDIITGVSLMLLFVFIRSVTNIELGFFTLLLAHITFNVPYVILSVMPKLRGLNKHLFEAALDLGATPIRAFWKVILPEIMPGVVSGALMAFTLSIDDFVISYFTAGSSVQTLPMTIFAMTRKRVSPEINAISTLLFTTVLLLLIVINVAQHRDQKKQKQKQ
ncbi:MAG: ABC transporter permease [Oscillospiraceae bacterium]|nr:ABC transporter permease [Oscillospiraceae bacterium]